ncbi:expressed unknown protein [Seminavis robusta]|uniref:Uncharacterized protein n=1 Tax=Seminavis robusta TaxID=568900 RepID=A0A9N8H7D9_9STRA|nr:expressed unknown protein [Seminavis robusta]|eukprot:Sro138_g064730.1 n/a (136) ;mRNA; f:46110-46517
MFINMMKLALVSMMFILSASAETGLRGSAVEDAEITHGQRELTGVIGSCRYKYQKYSWSKFKFVTKDNDRCVEAMTIGLTFSDTRQFPGTWPFSNGRIKKDGQCQAGGCQDRSDIGDGSCSLADTTGYFNIHTCK